MKKTFLMVAMLAATFSLSAQDAAAQPKDWKWSGMVGLNANATGMVNWAAGGKNNVTGTAYGKVRCLYEKNTLSWETNLDVAYGLSYVDQKYDQLQKASDHLKFNTKFGWAFAKQWYLTVNAGFQTQFDLGRDYLGTGAPNPVISNILAPSYTDISVGLDWKPNSIFSVYLSPVAGRITTAYLSDRVNEKFADQYALADGGLRQNLKEKYGVWKYTDQGDNGYAKDFASNAKAELGLTLKGKIDWSYKDLKIITDVTIFTPYAWDKTRLYDYNVGEVSGIYSDVQLEKMGLDVNEDFFLGYRDNNRRFGNFDVDWNVAISYQFLKCLNISLSTNLKYVNGLKIDRTDADGITTSAERVQFLANLGLGIGYSF